MIVARQTSRNAERVAEKLIEGAEHFEQVLGSNYWLGKLYRALAANDDFCDGALRPFGLKLISIGCRRGTYVDDDDNRSMAFG